MISDRLEAAAEASADAELWRDLPSSDYSESPPKVFANWQA